jgi:deoxyribodipyrimidine photolyase-related protein
VNAVWLVLGNQLFPTETYPSPFPERFFLAEDLGLCTYARHHRQKLVLFLSAMRSYADRLRESGSAVHYERLPDTGPDRDYEEKLGAYVDAHRIERIDSFEIEDKFMEERVRRFVERRGLSWIVHRSPMFLTSRDEFRAYLSMARKPFMKTFYERRRKELRVLLDENDRPVGGRWSFDEENRKRLPKGLVPPAPFVPEPTAHTRDVIRLVNGRFADHPGTTDGFWHVTTREQAIESFRRFLAERFDRFGDYEDAMAVEHDVLFHAALTPALNLGLLLPDEVLRGALAHAARRKTPLASLEGFVRQVMGWREFVRGIYQAFSERQETTNFFDHRRRPKPSWWTGSTGLLPLDHVIAKANRLGWAHHIERLMIAGNFFCLAEIEPGEAHRWFMELFVDSSDWVMGPNVYGMGIFSDGGIFATKPYVCGSNYLRKMGDFPLGDWCDVADGLYWRFVHAKRPFFAKNPRLAVMPRSLDKMAPEKRERLFAAAERFLSDHTS